MWNLASCQFVLNNLLWKTIANTRRDPEESVLKPFRPVSLLLGGGSNSYLVDSASSHMLVSKIKPCMSKYKHLYSETADGSLKQLWFI